MLLFSEAFSPFSLRCHATIYGSNSWNLLTRSECHCSVAMKIRSVLSEGSAYPIKRLRDTADWRHQVTQEKNSLWNSTCQGNLSFSSIQWKKVRSPWNFCELFLREQTRAMLKQQKPLKKMTKHSRLYGNPFLMLWVSVEPVSMIEFST